MTLSDQSRRYSPEPNILERKAASYLVSVSAPRQTKADSDVRETSLQRTERWAVFQAALAGIVSGSIIGGAEIFVRRGIFDGLEGVSWQAQLPYWAAFLAFSGVVSAVEIIYLYRIGLRTMAKVAGIVGAPLGGGGYADLAASGLARAALEFPNPWIRVFGIDPYALMPRWRLVVRNIAYKMKVGVTSFLLRVFLRRVAARMSVRGLVPLLAGPLYATWNAIIIWRIMQEARVRTLGPFAIEEFAVSLEHDTEAVDPAVGTAMLHGVGEMMVRGRDSHPNHVYLLARLRDVLGIDAEEIAADWQNRRGDLSRLSTDGQLTVVRAMTLAGLLGSRVHKGQVALLRETSAEINREFNRQHLRELRRNFTRGLPITPADLSGIVGKPEGG